MKGYILGCQRYFLDKWGYRISLLEGPNFYCLTDGLVSVLDNRFSAQQSKGMVTTSHILLSSDDLKTLYSSAHLSRDTPAGFKARMVFNLALITAYRPTALVELTTDQVRKEQRDGESVWIITAAVGSRVGASKTNPGGMAAVQEKSPQIFIWNRVVLEGQVNVYEDINEYMTLRTAVDISTTRFFLGFNLRAKNRSGFLKRAPMGKNSFVRIVKGVCDTLGIVGCEERNHMTMNGLRATTVSLLLKAGHADSSVAMRTGHRDVRSLKSYQNLGGALGKRQQEDIFGPPKKRLSSNHEGTVDGVCKPEHTWLQKIVRTMQD